VGAPPEGPFGRSWAGRSRTPRPSRSLSHPCRACFQRLCDRRPGAPALQGRPPGPTLPSGSACSSATCVFSAWAFESYKQPPPAPEAETRLNGHPWTTLKKRSEAGAGGIFDFPPGLPPRFRTGAEAEGGEPLGAAGLGRAWQAGSWTSRPNVKQPPFKTVTSRPSSNRPTDRRPLSPFWGRRRRRTCRTTLSATKSRGARAGRSAGVSPRGPGGQGRGPSIWKLYYNGSVGRARRSPGHSHRNGRLKGRAAAASGEGLAVRKPPSSR